MLRDMGLQGKNLLIHTRQASVELPHTARDLLIHTRRAGVECELIVFCPADAPIAISPLVFLSLLRCVCRPERARGGELPVLAQTPDTLG